MDDGSLEQKSQKTVSPQDLRVGQNPLDIPQGGELLPPQVLSLPWRYAGKIFILPGLNASEWESVGDASLATAPQNDRGLNYIEDSIIDSSWGAHEKIKIDKLDAKRPTMYAMFPDKFLGTIFLNASKMTEGDAQHHYHRSISAARIFVAIETRKLDPQGAKITDLFIKGYPVWSAMIPTERLIILQDSKGILKRLPEFSHRTLKDTHEEVTVTNQPVLWLDPRWLQDDALVASLANLYSAAQKKMQVNFIKKYPDGSPIDDETCVRIAQALNHMTIVRDKLLTPWCTDGNVLTGFGIGRNALIFEPSPQSYWRDKMVIDPRNMLIDSTTAPLVETMRGIFSQPWPQAHLSWNALPAMA